ncbi:unnamed protein product [Aphanomyces euteiches]
MQDQRRHVLRLYNACLASALKCPEQNHRETMRAYVRIKFRDKMHIRDTKAVSRLIADATEELDRMEYYHSMYRAGQAQKQAKASSTPTMRLAAHCPNCNYEFTSEKAKFCSECGVQRPTLV